MKKILLILVLVIFPINSFAWYTELDNPDVKIDLSKVKINTGDFHIASGSNPNLDTLKYYMMKYSLVQVKELLKHHRIHTNLIQN